MRTMSSSGVAGGSGCFLGGGTDTTRGFNFTSWTGGSDEAGAGSGLRVIMISLIGGSAGWRMNSPPSLICAGLDERAGHLRRGGEMWASGLGVADRRGVA